MPQLTEEQIILKMKELDLVGFDCTRREGVKEKSMLEPSPSGTNFWNKMQLKFFIDENWERIWELKIKFGEGW